MKFFGKKATGDQDEILILESYVSDFAGDIIFWKDILQKWRKKKNKNRKGRDHGYYYYEVIMHRHVQGRRVQVPVPKSLQSLIQHGKTKGKNKR